MAAAQEMYLNVQRESWQDADAFWGRAARSVSWIKRPQRIRTASAWFGGGTLNMCFNALDRHVVAGRGDQDAVIHVSSQTKTTTRHTYAQLLDLVARFAGVLRSFGVGKGDRVVILMPLAPEALIAILACARIGAVHSVMHGSFAPAELAARMDDAQPTVVVTASCGVARGRVVAHKRLLDHALRRTQHQPQAVVVLQRGQVRADMDPSRDFDWHELMRPGTVPAAECVEMAAADPLAIFYTLGTMGQLPGVVRTCGEHTVALDWSMRNVYQMGPGDVMCTSSHPGWIPGHSSISYGPLICGGTTVLLEGEPTGMPDAENCWQVAAEHGVKTVLAPSSAVRSLKKHDATGDGIGGHDLSSLAGVFLVGEPLDPETYRWIQERLASPVRHIWWQTDTMWPSPPMGIAVHMA